jgi:hypothetical protein
MCSEAGVRSCASSMREFGADPGEPDEHAGPFAGRLVEEGQAPCAAAEDRHSASSRSLTPTSNLYRIKASHEAVTCAP